MFKKRMSVILSCIFALMFLVQGASYGQGLEEAFKYPVSPMMEEINKANHDLLITGGQAYIECSIQGNYTTTDKVKIYCRLQQYENGRWTTIKSWNEEFNDYIGSIYETFGVDKGYSYRINSSFYAYKGNKLLESITKTSREIKY